MNLQQAFDLGFEAVKEYVDRSVGDLDGRIAALETRAPERGIDGKDGAPASVEQIDQAVKSYLEKNPPAPGRDADPVTEDQLANVVSRYFAANPIVNGKDGRGISELIIDRSGQLNVVYSDGSTKLIGPVVGRDGQNGEDGKDGRDGTDGKDGAPGRDGTDGKDGAPGRDGTDGKDGNPGLPGKDGFSLEHFDAELMKDGRTLLLKFDDGSDISFAVELGIPVMIYRDLFVEGREYDRGDVVTWNGSMWHCNEATSSHPREGTDAWTLCVKHGRNGRDSVPIKVDPKKSVKI